jgi:hypothetical protein
MNTQQIDLQSQFDSLKAVLEAESCLVETDVLPLDKVLVAAHRSAGERAALLSKCSAQSVLGEGGECMLTVVDTVSVATAHALKGAENVSDHKLQGSATLVDLLGKAEACRALWFETYALWPGYELHSRRRALAESVLQLASEATGVSLRLSQSCQQFVDFVAKVSGLLEQIRRQNP